MNYKEVFAALEKYAPLKLSDELVKAENGYDNSGIILANDGEIKNIAFALDLTVGAVEFAKEKNCNLIVTHHPAIYRPVKSFGENSPLRLAAKNNMAIISMHLNLDCAEKGIDYYLAEGLGGKVIKISEPLGKNEGYGRLSAVSGITTEQLAEKYKNTFNTDKVWVYGDKDRKITKIASFCGAGLDENAVNCAVENGAEVVVSADISHHVLLSALENGLCVLACTHYDTEIYGFEKFFRFAAERFKNENIYFYRDERLS